MQVLLCSGFPVAKVVHVRRSMLKYSRPRYATLAIGIIQLMGEGNIQKSTPRINVLGISSIKMTLMLYLFCFRLPEGLLALTALSKHSLF